jgi:formylglycine-generating enzyme required for sulfatase activity
MDEKPVHNVCVNGFWMGRYEVTQAQWQAIMGQNHSSSYNNPEQPVEHVSYEEVQQFIMALNRNTYTDAYRLPSEAEWEYAARANSSTLHHFGDDADHLKQHAWYVRNSGNRPHSVGQLQPNPYGLYDMYGNVWEWCVDRYDARYYANSSTDNPRGSFSGSDRIARGGSWAYEAQYCRSGYRFHHPPYFRSADLGFRLVRESD